jgi:hypothetical protein
VRPIYATHINGMNVDALSGFFLGRNRKSTPQYRPNLEVLIGLFFGQWSISGLLSKVSQVEVV